MGNERTVKTFEGFFTMLGQETCAGIEFVCSDMWQPYIRVIRERCSQAVHIPDRFHIVAKMNDALDDVRAYVTTGSAEVSSRPFGSFRRASALGVAHRVSIPSCTTRSLG